MDKILRLTKDQFNSFLNGKSFSAIDTTFYFYSNDDPNLIYKSNIGSFDDEVSSLLVEKNYKATYPNIPKYSLRNS